MLFERDVAEAMYVAGERVSRLRLILKTPKQTPPNRDGKILKLSKDPAPYRPGQIHTFDRGYEVRQLAAIAGKNLVPTNLSAIPRHPGKKETVENYNRSKGSTGGYPESEILRQLTDHDIQKKISDRLNKKKPHAQMLGMEGTGGGLQRKLSLAKWVDHPTSKVNRVGSSGIRSQLASTRHALITG